MEASTEKTILLFRGRSPKPTIGHILITSDYFEVVLSNFIAKVSRSTEIILECIPHTRESFPNFLLKFSKRLVFCIPRSVLTQSFNDLLQPQVTHDRYYLAFLLSKVDQNGSQCQKCDHFQTSCITIYTVFCVYTRPQRNSETL